MTSHALVRALLVPMSAWAAHFFLGYGLALALPTSGLLDWLILSLTIGVEAFLFLTWRRSATLGADRMLVRQSVFIAALAVAWQGLIILF